MIATAVMAASSLSAVTNANGPGSSGNLSGGDEGHARAGRLG
jgi:hypothetical protein